MKKRKSAPGHVVDAQGRRRLHGAFTGGFSAGYFNTVGSKEGWAPSSQGFRSSRGARADPSAFQQHARDFMDEEDDPLSGRALQISSGGSGVGGVAARVAKSVDALGRKADEFSVPMSDIKRRDVPESEVKNNNFGLGFDPFKAADEFRKPQARGGDAPFGSGTVHKRFGLSALEDDDDNLDLYDDGSGNAKYVREIRDLSDDDDDNGDIGPVRPMATYVPQGLQHQQRKLHHKRPSDRDPDCIPGFVVAEFRSMEAQKISSGSRRGLVAPISSTTILPRFHAPAWFPRLFRHCFTQPLAAERATTRDLARNILGISISGPKHIIQKERNSSDAKHLHKGRSDAVTSKPPPAYLPRATAVSAAATTSILSSRFTRGSGSNPKKEAVPTSSQVTSRGGLSTVDDFVQRRLKAEAEELSLAGSSSNGATSSKVPRRPREVLDWSAEHLLCKRLGVTPSAHSRHRRAVGKDEGKWTGSAVGSQQGTLGRVTGDGNGAAVIAEPSWDLVEQEVDKLFSLF